MRLLLCILVVFTVLFSSCTSVPPAEPAEEAAQEGAKKEASRVEFVKLLAETAAKGDRVELHKMFVPLSVIVEIARLLEKPIGEEEMQEVTKQYGEMIDDKVKGCLLCFKENDPKSLRFEDFGMSEFTANEKAEIENLNSKSGHMTDHGDVQVSSGGRRIIGARVFRYKGTWYCTDMF
jgi:hypothetical protein